MSIDNYIVKDHMQYFGRECMLVWHFKGIGENLNAQELAELYIASHVPALCNLQSEHLTHTHVEAYSMFDEAEFVDISLTENNVGLVQGAGMPTFVTWTIRLNRTNRGVRNGRKSIPGVSETQVENNEINSSVLESMNELCAVLGQSLLAESGNIWKPVIYHYPTPHSPQPLTVEVSSATYVHVGTQNSRKTY